MDRYSFLIELNSSLDFHLEGQDKTKGTFGEYYYVISFEPDGRIRVHTNVRLFGDLPLREHIESAYEKLTSFSSYTLEDDSIDLYADIDGLTSDKAFAITVDLSSFSNTLKSFGYKSAELPKPAEEPIQQNYNDSYQQTAVIQEEPVRHLPRGIGRGILGAFIGAVGSMGLFILLSLTNYMTAFIFGVILVLIVPVLLYEVFSKEKTSGIQITISFFFSTVALLLGDRLIWTFDLMRNFDELTFSDAYWEVPYLVEDGALDWMDYYQDFIAIFAALALFLIFFCINYIKGGKNVRELLSKRTR